MGGKDPIHLLISLGGQGGEMLEVEVEINLESIYFLYYSDLEHFATHDEDFNPWNEIGKGLHETTGL